MPTILITGAARGLGLEFSRQYAVDGWQVIAACRDPAKADALQKLAAQYKNIQIETLDVTDAASIAALAKKLQGTALDILINNAGIYSGSGAKNDNSQSFGTIDAEAWNKVLRTNTIAPIMVAEAFTGNLRSGHEKKLVFISSMMGSIARQSTGAIAYRTSKAALNMAMRNIAEALSTDGITAVSFHPGWVKTDMGGSGADITPETSVTGMCGIIAKLTLKQSGSFLGYDGQSWPW